MRFEIKSTLKNLLKEELGQTLPFTAVILVSLVGMSGMAVDAGHGYYAYERLKVATNAATLAGAAGMPNTTTAQDNVTTYSSAAGDKNYLGTLMSNVAATTTFSCSSTVANTLGVSCLTASGSAGGYNALTVKQTATVKTWFGSLFGIPQFNIAASSMASMAGGENTVYNVAVIMDTTRSMSDADSGKQCSGTQISCALQGFQALLNIMYPCPTDASSCTTSSKAVDAVSLWVFPPILTSTASNDYTCPSSDPTHEWYEVPTLPTTWTYELPFGSSTTPVPWSTDYRTSDTASSLNSSSDIVIAAGGGGCDGVSAPGGAGTYYAQAIYLAQAALVAQQTNNPGSKNALIILTDGDATSTATGTGSGGAFPSTTCSGGSAGYCMSNYSSSSDLIPSVNGGLNGVTGNNPTSYTYPSAVGECGQAVIAAQDAANAGTTVFTFAYGAETTNSCTSDKTYSASVTTNGGSWGPGDQACAAIAAMASATANFYSDDANGCAATNSYNASITSLKSMFQHAWNSLTSARLIPVGTT
jgi:hypothetical protein